MRLEVCKYLFDMQQACLALVQFSAGKTFTDYSADLLLRSAVERQFEIVGEALNQLLKLDPAFTSFITDSKNIIGFRNVLVHGYAQIKHDLVWDALENKLPLLKAEVERLLVQEQTSSSAASPTDE